MRLPYCTRSVHTASSLARCLCQKNGACGRAQRRKRPRMRGSPSTPLPWSLPTFLALVPSGSRETRLPPKVDSIHRLKQHAQGIFAVLFYWSGFFLHKTQQFEQRSRILSVPLQTGVVPLFRHLPRAWGSPSPWVSLHFCHGAPGSVRPTLSMHPNGQLEGNAFAPSNNFQILYNTWSFIILTRKVKGPISYRTGKWRAMKILLRNWAFPLSFGGNHLFNEFAICYLKKPATQMTYVKHTH